MIKIVNSNPYGPLDQMRLQALERRFGTSLPDDYRDYLITHNGGTPEGNLFIPPGRSEPFACLCETLFGLHNSNGQLDKVYGICLDYLPTSLLPFGEDNGGDLFCIGLRDERRGKIFFWDHHSQSLGNEEPSFENVKLILVAPTFTEFLNGLRREA